MPEAKRKTTPAKSAGAQGSTPSLGRAQEDLESASKELLNAQKAFTAAQQRLSTAEQAHTDATVALSQEFEKIRTSNKVPNLHAR